MNNESLTNLARKLRSQGTPAERILWSKLRNKQFNGVKFRRQQLLGNYIVDFISFDKRLIVEIDGGQHDEQWISKQDAVRTACLNSQGYRVIRFWNNEILENLEGALLKIKSECNLTPSPFSSSPIEGEKNGKDNNLNKT